MVAGELLHGSLDHLSLRLDAGNWIDAALRPRLPWPRRSFGAFGPAHVLPGLNQYWHPVLLDADVTGEACVGGRRMRLDGGRAYAEKNWGPRFAGRWRWGQAAAFSEAELDVASAGGHLPLLGASPAPSAVVVHLGRRVLSFGRPWLGRRCASVAAIGGLRQIRRAAASRSRAKRERWLPTVCRCPSSAHPTGDALSAGARRAYPPAAWRGRHTLIESISALAGLELGQPRPGGPRP